MAIEDNNPERRNLIVTSLAIILYYLADGQIVDTDIRIQLINLKFNNREALIWFAWIMLLWFALRFWQKNSGIFYESTTKHCNILSNNWLLKWYLCKTFRVNTNEFNIIYVDNWTVLYNKKGEPNQCHQGLTGFYGTIVKSLLIIYLIITKESFGSLVVPYILFYWAVLLGGLHLVGDLAKRCPSF